MNRAAFIQKLEATIATYAAAGNVNQAVNNHLAKVQKMDEAQFTEHYARLEAMKIQSAASVNRMVASVRR